MGKQVMTAEQQIELIEKTAEEVNGKVRSYSGRGMYGRRCYGITCVNSTECIEVAAANGLRGASFDNMGLDWIVYWPAIEYVERK